MAEQFYHYCIIGPLPDSTNQRGNYIYKRIGANNEKRLKLSPVFDSYKEMKIWMADMGFEDASHACQQGLSGVWNAYVPFRLRLNHKKNTNYQFLNPLAKTQKINLPPKIEVDKTPEIGLQDDYIVLCAGKIEKV